MRTRTIIILFVLIFMITESLPAQSLRPLEPPFRKQWECHIGDSCLWLAENNSIICFSACYSYGAINERTGKKLWMSNLKEPTGLNSLIMEGDILYMAVSEKWLKAFEARTGRVVWSLPVLCRSNEMVLKDSILYIMLRGGVVTALDTRSRRTLWKSDLTPWLSDRERFGRGIFPNMLVVGNRLIVNESGHNIHCLDMKTGAILWRYHTLDSHWGIVAYKESLITRVNEGDLTAISISSGKILWKARSLIHFEDEPVMLGDNVICHDFSEIYAFRASDGSLAWRCRPPGAEASCMVHCKRLKDHLVTMAGTMLTAFDCNGNIAWKSDIDEEFNNCEFEFLKQGVAVANQKSLYKLVQGKPSGGSVSPEERNAFIQRCLSHIENLSKAEIKCLCRMGNDAFEAIYPMVKQSIEYCKKMKEDNKDASARKNQELKRLRKYVDVLAEVASEENTANLIALLNDINDTDCRDKILESIAQKGDEEITIPLFIDILSRRTTGWVNTKKSYSIALDGILSTENEAATDFLCKELIDVNADPVIRHNAFVSLACNGSEQCLRAVQAVSADERTIPGLEQFMRLDKLPVATSSPEFSCGFLKQLLSMDSKELKGNKGKELSLAMIGNKAEFTGLFESQLLSMEKDRDGTMWGLMTSAAAGSVFDLWVIQKNRDGKITPYFTGISYLDLDRSKGSLKLPTREELMKDSDGDGWTDLLEKRFGTDPGKADTDGDGLSDSIDMNPLITPGPLDQRQEILKAAFEARFKFGWGRNVPCLVRLPDGIEPFEFTGWGWVTISFKAGQKLPLRKLINEGVAIVSFRAPENDFDRRKIIKRDSEDFILWNKDHSEAKFEFVTHYGELDATGYSVHLKKINGHWYVIELDMNWIS